MVYSTSFDHDIFISYARVDNQPDGGKCWVSLFQDELVKRLDRHLGQIGAAKIWWDSDLDGSQVFNQTIRDTINRSALFLALTSEGYLQSDYCQKELDWFCEKAKAEPPGLIVGDRARIFNILIDDIPHKRWPPEYGGTNGYHFYDAEVDSPLEVGVREFKREIAKMVVVIGDLLKAMKGVPSEEEEAKAKEKESFTVFIADTATSLKNVRSRVYNDLRQKGISVIDRIPPPRAMQEHEKAVLEKVKGADLCVHLLDDVPGGEIDDEPSKSYLERQAELSLEHSRSQFVWVPSELTTAGIELVEDEAHKKLLQKLEAGPRRSDNGYKFVRDLPSTVSHDILERIEQIKKEREAVPPPNGEPLAALVDTHFKDQQYVMGLSSFLLQQQVIPLINREEDSPQKNLEVFESQLRKASLFIVVFGGVPTEWVRERLGEALKIAVTQNCPLRACGVYLAPPRKNAEEVQFNRGFFPVEVLDNSERFNPQTLAPLLARIQAGV
jgi:hypothetical protein